MASVVGCRLSVVGCRLSVVGWWLVVGGWWSRVSNADCPTHVRQQQSSTDNYSTADIGNSRVNTVWPGRER
ncbi:hypothetical protein FKV23_15965 [Lysobacter alkalisoli]|uniref:Uncharacterized protein n=1 Tax=Marilutibacter alkalisoli TaxID=2591633 RepID=A0A514BVJ4_9GAMM|nr:hypothetical protein FKV23_15965 [Lysobacter alkalisoli]